MVNTTMFKKFNMMATSILFSPGIMWIIVIKRVINKILLFIDIKKSSEPHDAKLSGFSCFVPDNSEKWSEENARAGFICGLVQCPVSH